MKTNKKTKSVILVGCIVLMAILLLGCLDTCRCYQLVKECNDVSSKVLLSRAKYLSCQQCEDSDSMCCVAPECTNAGASVGAGTEPEHYYVVEPGCKLKYGESCSE